MEQVYLLADTIHQITKGYSHEQVYQLLCKLAGAVGKELTYPEQIEVLKARCDKWIKNPDCFSE